ncbi:hypothetical protein CCMA1212_008912 [Trichoderma ghanense]|uniref:Uncharacterized protein n=1 Tax=Trichoderma ghanense TaxID=65468 RepID=A0ABY2GU86_9HYPO
MSRITINSQVQKAKTIEGQQKLQLTQGSVLVDVPFQALRARLSRTSLRMTLQRLNLRRERVISILSMHLSLAFCRSMSFHLMWLHDDWLDGIIVAKCSPVAHFLIFDILDLPREPHCGPD